MVEHMERNTLGNTCACPVCIRESVPNLRPRKTYDQQGEEQLFNPFLSYVPLRQLYVVFDTPYNFNNSSPLLRNAYTNFFNFFYYVLLRKKEFKNLVLMYYTLAYHLFLS